MALTLVLPIAGNGSRFRQAGFLVPKPFIKVAGLSMVERAIANLPRADRVVLIHLAEHEQWVYHLQVDNLTAVSLPGVTQGQACTVMAAASELGIADELIVADCDQWLDWAPEHFLSYVRQRDADGAMTIFHGMRAHWSFVHVTPDMWVEAVIEKVPISNHAVAGVRYYKRTSFALSAIERTIEEPTVGEYYLGSAYNELIRRGRRILAYPVPRVYSMGTPAELELTLSTAPFAKDIQNETRLDS